MTILYKVKDFFANMCGLDTQPEKLTKKALKRLFGADYKYVCIYNNETQKLAADYYNGQYIYWGNDDTVCSKQLKEQFGATFPKFELVAQVIIQVANKDFPGWGKWTKEPVNFDKNGNNAVANLIIRSKETRKLELLKGGAWFGVCGHANPRFAARFGASWLAIYGGRNPYFRNALFAGRGQR